MQGTLLALTPLAILFSAFVFFNSLQVTQVGFPPRCCPDGSRTSAAFSALTAALYDSPSLTCRADHAVHRGGGARHVLRAPSGGGHARAVGAGPPDRGRLRLWHRPRHADP